MYVHEIARKVRPRDTVLTTLTKCMRNFEHIRRGRRSISTLLVQTDRAIDASDRVGGACRSTSKASRSTRNTHHGQNIPHQIVSKSANQNKPNESGSGSGSGAGLPLGMRTAAPEGMNRVASGERKPCDGGVPVDERMDQHKQKNLCNEVLDKIRQGKG